VSAVLLVILLARALPAPIDPYGSNGGAWIEHVQAARATLAMSEAMGGHPGALSWWLVSMDVGFPPVLQLMAIPVTALTNGSPHGLLPITIGLLFLLAWSVARIGRAMTGRVDIAAAAFVGTLLVPSLHGSSLRYYYDLPMTAFVWAAAATMFVHWDRSPRRAAASGLALALLASFTKWTAVPFLLCVLLGAALTRRSLPGEPTPTIRKRPRAVALGLVLSGWFVVVKTYMVLRGGEDSLSFTARESGGTELDPEGGGPGLVFGMVSRMIDRLGHLPEVLDKLGDYGLGLAVSVFSPLLLAVVVGLLVVGALRRGAGPWLVTLTVLGQLGFLLFFVDPIDERFLITLAPALVLGAAVGWGCLGSRGRRVVGIGACSLGLLVAADMHHGEPTGPSTWWSGLPVWGEAAPDAIPPPIRPRGILTSSSSGHRGWARRDAARPLRQPLRDAVDSWMRECAPVEVAAADGVDLIGPHGDHDWITWRNLVWCLEDPACVRHRILPLELELDLNGDVPPPGVRIIHLLDETGAICHGPPIDPGTLVLSIERRDGARQLPPPCPAGVSWELVALIPDPEGGDGVGAWAEEGTSPCSRILDNPNSDHWRTVHDR